MIDLQSIIKIPDFAQKGVFKCRVVYGATVESVTFSAYRKKIINKLVLKEAPGLNYDHKYADRSGIEILQKNLPRRTEILITKNHLITDASYANVAFFDGEKWLTPAQPLLHGTCRAHLIAEGKIARAEIHKNDLHLFKKIRLFNAMTDWKNAWELDAFSAF